MVKNIIAAAALLGLTLSPGAAFAVPVDLSVAHTAAAENPVDQVRLYCVNRYTGQFLYWGRCGGWGYRRRIYYRPRYRVYCRTRYSHRFLHWGYC